MKYRIKCGGPDKVLGWHSEIDADKEHGVRETTIRTAFDIYWHIPTDWKRTSIPYRARSSLLQFLCG